MTIQVEGETIQILGKTYQIKCDEKQVISLQKTAEFLEERMLQVRRSLNLLSVDRVAVVTALQLAYELLNLDHRTLDLINKLDTALE